MDEKMSVREMGLAMVMLERMAGMCNTLPNGGELRYTDTPENYEFLMSLTKGDVPIRVPRREEYNGHKQLVVCMQDVANYLTNKIAQAYNFEV